MGSKEDEAARRRKEAERRAGILRRYSALVEPTASDMAAYAADIGVGYGRFDRMARAWRVHGADSVRATEAKNDPARVISAIEAAEGELDMTAVPAAMRQEIERRIRIVGRYLRAKTEGRVDRLDFAKEYGATYVTFRTAVTSWLLTPDPAAFPVVKRAATRRTPAERPARPFEAVIARAIEELGANAGLTALHRRTAELCHHIGINPPSMTSVNTRMNAARVAIQPVLPETTTLKLDRVMVDVPDGVLGTRAAILVVLFGARTGRIHSYALAAQADMATDAAALKAYVEETRPTPDAEEPALLEWSVPHGEAWTDLSDALASAGVATWTPASRGMGSVWRLRASLGKREKAGASSES